MVRGVVKQPNGLYCIFSSVCDDFTLMGATREEVVEEMVFRNGSNADLKALDRADEDHGPWAADAPQDGLNRWRSVLGTVKAVHGEKLAADRQAIGEKPAEKPVPPPGGNIWGLVTLLWVHTEKSDRDRLGPMPTSESMQLVWKPNANAKEPGTTMIVHFRKHDFVTRTSEAWMSVLNQEDEHHIADGRGFYLRSARQDFVCQAKIRMTFSRSEKLAQDRAIRHAVGLDEA